MKNFKVSIFSVLIVLLAFTSCTNEETIVDTQQNTEESESITTTLGRLSQQYDENGNVDQTNNPAGNIVFDFCFDFVYPIDLSFNTDTTVTVNSLDELIDIYSSSTENLFINGIAFPFQVETYNENSNTLEIETINNEDEFFSLLEDCNFDEIEDCYCTEEYDPVCVNVTDLDGELFTISYPNACYAICDGFTEDDFSEECEQDYDSGAGECFEFVYPISIILDEGDPVIVNSREELFNATYGAYHIDLVLPLDIIIEGDTVVTINDYDELEAIIEECFGDSYGDIDCSIEDITNTLVNCFWQIDFVDDDQYLYNLNSDGTYQVQSGDSLLTFGTWNIVTGNDTFYLTLNANTSEYSDEWVVTVCDENLEMQSLVFPQAELYSIDCYDDNIDCSIGDITNTLADYCWSIDFIDNSEFIYNLNSDGTYQLQDIGGNTGGIVLTSGAWSVAAGNGTFYITLNAELTEYNDEWVVYYCDEEMGLILGSIDYPQAQIYSIDCNDDGNDDNNYDCSSEEGASNILTECPWIIDYIDFNEFIYFFNIDGTYEVQSDNNILTTGTWEFGMTNNAYTINLSAELTEYNDTWVVYDCDEEIGLTLGSIDYPQAEIYSVDCD
ncbi:hypothetical protein N9X15_00550 [Flavobacteriaceae bacterium]|jgi:hypothetical protein|nr:hypothetical protein [Flavobacteriaceae bacterium]